MNSASPEGVDAALKLLTSTSSPAIIASDDVAKADAFGPLVRISEQLGAPVWYETLRHESPFQPRIPMPKLSFPSTPKASGRCWETRMWLCFWWAFF